VTASLTFLGAAGTVTGAKFLLSTDGIRLLLVAPRNFCTSCESWRRTVVSRGCPSTSTVRWESRRPRSTSATPPNTIRHGEPAAAAALRDAIEQRLGWRCEVAADLQQIDL